jgi:hypothetical protein
MRKYLELVHGEDFIRNLPDQISNNPTMINLLHSVFLHTIPSSTSNDFDYCQFIDSSTRSNLLLTGSESLPPSCNPTNINRETLINPAHFNCLYQFYYHVYSSHYNLVKIGDPDSSGKLIIDSRIERFYEITILGQKFRSVGSGSNRGMYIQAMMVDGSFRVGRILYFFHNYLRFPFALTRTTNKDVKHTFAFIQWFKAPPYSFLSFANFNLQIWKNSFEPSNFESILPIARIYTTVAIQPYIDNNIIAIPLPRKTIAY